MEMLDFLIFLTANGGPLANLVGRAMRNNVPFGLDAVGSITTRPVTLSL